MFYQGLFFSYVQKTKRYLQKPDEINQNTQSQGSLVWLKTEKTRYKVHQKFAKSLQWPRNWLWCTEFCKLLNLPTYTTPKQNVETVTNRIFWSKLDRCSSIVTPKEIPWWLIGWKQQAQNSLKISADAPSVEYFYQLCCRVIHGNPWPSKSLSWDWRAKVKSSSQCLWLPPLACALLSVCENNSTVPGSLREQQDKDKTLHSEVSFLFFISTRSWPKAFSSWLLSVHLLPWAFHQHRLQCGIKLGTIIFTHKCNDKRSPWLCLSKPRGPNCKKWLN